MIEHIWSILCQKSVIDNDTNNLSLIDTLEELTVGLKVQSGIAIAEEVNVPIPYEVVSFWVRDDSSATINPLLRLELFNPSNKKTKTFEHKIEFPKGTKRLRSRLKIIGIGVTIPGTYKFVVSIKEEESKSFMKVAEIPLDVTIAKEDSSVKKNLRHQN